jgi:hypothetical protein
MNGSNLCGNNFKTFVNVITYIGNDSKSFMDLFLFRMSISSVFSSEYVFEITLSPAKILNSKLFQIYTYYFVARHPRPGIFSAQFSASFLHDAYFASQCTETQVLYLFITYKTKTFPLSGKGVFF